MAHGSCTRPASSPREGPTPWSRRRWSAAPSHRRCRSRPSRLTLQPWPRPSRSETTRACSPMAVGYCGWRSTTWTRWPETGDRRKYRRGRERSEPMKIAMVGLGKMGANMTERLIRAGHQVVAYDLSSEARAQAAANGAIAADDLDDLAAKLDRPRAAWVMVPAGPPTDSTIDALAERFGPGDVIVDGGNSNYKSAKPTADRLATKQIGFVDAGTSGGVWGLTEGYCLMVGGTKEAVAVVEPALRSLAPEGGYAHVGPVGAGHFVKMVHNGIEYGLMQAYAEGFEIMRSATEFDLDLHEIASIWRYGSVVRS